VDVVLGCEHRSDPIPYYFVIVHEHDTERRALRSGHPTMVAQQAGALIRLTTGASP